MTFGSIPPETVLTGKIIDAFTGKPIPGATIYIADLKSGSISDAQGNYVIKNLPESRIRVQVTCIGYKMVVETIDLATTTNKDFALQESVSELNEIVVTGLSQASEKHRTPTPITTIPSIMLQQHASVNIMDALVTQPGISQVTTGVGISKPVIRGLGFNRVVVVNDGIRQEGQQWGDEHGIEIDEFSVDHVEILKGPASLVYGSDAMAGVINFLNAPTLPEGTIEGKVLAGYHTNNGLFAWSANLAGNKNDFVWDLRWSQKLAHAYKNEFDGYVLNSGFSERTLSGIAGVNKSWGYSHLHFSMYQMKPGIVEGERDSLTGAFIKPVALNDTSVTFDVATAGDLKSYSVMVPFQKIEHIKAVLNNNILIGDGSLKTILGWQQNRRREYGDILDPGNYGLYFLLNSINYDFRYVFDEYSGFNISMGINGMYQDSDNQGGEYLVPEYRLFDAGIYGIAKKTIDKLDISFGLRFDYRKQHGDDLYLDEEGNKTSETDTSAVQRFTKFQTDFSGFSGSVGATYQFSEILYTKLNLARGYRAPNIAELGSNGEHEGSGRYEIGNPQLKAEQSMQVDFTFGINSDHVTGELNLFNNTISNFIFISRVPGNSGADSLVDGMPVYVFSSGKANLAGGEISIDIHPHPLDWLHFENSFAYVEGVRSGQTGSSKYLPFMPAPKFTSELKATSKKIARVLINPYVKLGIDYYFAQDKIYAVNNTETRTGKYSLINLGAGTDIMLKNKILFSLYFSVNNLADVAYQSHLSRLKYAPVNYATGRQGVFEMGRNISFKIIVPLKFR